VASGSTVLEIGCGTGNYVHALSPQRPDINWLGVDVSQPMLRQAIARDGQVSLVRADAASAIPVRSASCTLAFAVDVIHHIADLRRFFAESARVLAPAGRLVLVTDSEETMRRRSLTRFFPEIQAIEMRRLPELDELHAHAAAAGLAFLEEESADGETALSDDFVRRLAAKCGSSMRLISEEQHAAGMTRVRAAQARGERWRSCYIVLHYGAP
jgi:ubiquinone/menaquinone biosynthesis C-methylase UbiE